MGIDGPKRRRWQGAGWGVRARTGGQVSGVVDDSANGNCGLDYVRGQKGGKIFGALPWVVDPVKFLNSRTGVEAVRCGFVWWKPRREDKTHNRTHLFPRMVGWRPHYPCFACWRSITAVIVTVWGEGQLCRWGPYTSTQDKAALCQRSEYHRLDPRICLLLQQAVRCIAAGFPRPALCLRLCQGRLVPCLPGSWFSPKSDVPLHDGVRG